MKYYTYKIIGKTAYAKGKKYKQPAASTINAFIKMGVNKIVWMNGDNLFI